MNETPLLSVDGLTVCYQQRDNWYDFHTHQFFALQNVSLQLQRGHILAIVGESGSGKTTIARCLTGLTKPTAGRIRFDSSQSTRHSPLRQNYVQYVFQDPFASLNPGMSVDEVVLEPLGYQRPRPDKSDQQKKLQQIFAQVGLDYQQRHRYPHEFSGGQCQRIAIARALIAEPDLLISDEPVSALDVSVRAQVINLLRDLNQKSHLSQIFIAHDLWLARHLSHDVVVLYQGQVMESGPCKQVFDSPRHPYTHALIEAIPYADPRQERQRNRPRTVATTRTSQGCPYAPRCLRAQENCFTCNPAPRHLTDNHQVACFYPMDD